MAIVYLGCDFGSSPVAESSSWFGNGYCNEWISHRRHSITFHHDVVDFKSWRSVVCTIKSTAVSMYWFNMQDIPSFGVHCSGIQSHCMHFDAGEIPTQEQSQISRWWRATTPSNQTSLYRHIRLDSDQERQLLHVDACKHDFSRRLFHTVLLFTKQVLHARWDGRLWHAYSHSATCYIT